MVQTKKPREVIDKAMVYEMRQAGATMHDIGKNLGVSRERVRQILLNTYGSTNHELLTTAHLCSLSGASNNQVMQLYKKRIITPTFSYNVGEKRRLLWSKLMIQTMKNYFRLTRVCRVCKAQLPSSRRCYCSDRCHQERYTYRNLPIEEKERVLNRQFLYRKKRKKSLINAALVTLEST